MFLGDFMNKELDFLIRIVKEAEEISKESFNVDSKGDDYDLITSLDTKIENYLISQIKNEYPDFDIVSEENNYNKDVSDNCFIIDPIDGTINFAIGIPLWSIQVCCYKDGKPVASVINFPKLNELYYADETAAYLNGNKIHVKEFPISKAVYSIDGMGSAFATNKMRKYTSNRRNLGALCASLVYVASGVMHGAVFRDDKAWDYAPGLHLIKMAGGVICSEPGFHAGAMNEEFLNLLKQVSKRESHKSNLFILDVNEDKSYTRELKQLSEGNDIYTFIPLYTDYGSFVNRLNEYIDNKKLNDNSFIVCDKCSKEYLHRFEKEYDYIPLNCVEIDSISKDEIITTILKEDN